MLEEAEGIEDLVAVAAIPSAGAHFVEDERELLFGVIVWRPGMVDGGEGDEGGAAAVELGEEGFEPVRLLVIDGDGKAGHRDGAGPFAALSLINFSGQ